MNRTVYRVEYSVLWGDLEDDPSMRDQSFKYVLVRGNAMKAVESIKWHEIPKQESSVEDAPINRNRRIVVDNIKRVCEIDLEEGQ